MESQPAYDTPGDADLEGILEAKDQEISRLLGVLREQAAALETLSTRQSTSTAQAQETQAKLQQELALMTAEADKARALAFTHQQESSRLITIQTAIEERNKHLVDGLDSLHKQNAAGQGTLQSSVTACFTATQTTVTSAKTEIHARIDKLPAHTEALHKDLAGKLTSQLESFQTQVTTAHDRTQTAQNELNTLTASLADRIRLLEQLVQIQSQAATSSAEKTEQLTAAMQQHHDQQTRRLDTIVDQLMASLNSRFVRWPLLVKTWLTPAPKQK
ncbi:hypothetical protein CMV30_12645 [Nibricoccus aquaticus]|uniref:Uncharacterized protein n=1 Tax=Nibricoccus aquaticus TaxID=2576891 RepID=A0A290QK78_9BACT|nr:hypothetical protein [Nibricoccus aquaticus]ATC64741.1 hypothetical protein CMV30_12645 [Nibricoccus aquaticus]